MRTYTKKLLAAGAAAAVLATTAACGTVAPNDPQAPTNPNVTHQPLPPADLPPDVSAIAYLGQRMFPLVQAEFDIENVVFSPASVFIALAMTGDGARGDTAEAFQAALGLSREEANQLATGLLDEWAAFGGTERQEPKVDVSAANSVWLAEQAELLPAFADGLQADYDAKATTVDFDDPATAEQINGWIKDETDGLIKEMLREIDPDTLMMLVNALHFKGSWIEEFDEEATGPDDFTLSSGEVTQVETMHGTVKGGYFEAEDGSRGAVLPYGGSRGTRFGMLAVLPAEGAEQIDWAGGERLKEWMDLVKYQPKIAVSLPKWQVNTGTMEFKKSLEALGLGPAFAAQADFSGMVRDSAGVYVNSVKHSAVVMVDETGTEAPDATVAGTDDWVETPPYILFEIDFDRPFFYAIMDLETGVPLFMGLMANPEA